HTPIQGLPGLVAEQQERAVRDPRIKPAYAAMVERLDASVGRVLDALDRSAITDNTVVFFLSDNGGHGLFTDNAPLRGSKGMLYEGGIRVPLIVAGSGVSRIGAEERTPVIGTDIFPTVLDLVGVPDRVETSLDGRSLRPLFDHASVAAMDAEDERLWEERPLFWHFPAYLEAYRAGDGHWRTTPAAAVRIGRYKLIEFFEDGRRELYDLRSDPGELQDVAASMPERVAALARAAHDWRADTAAPVPHEREPGFVTE
ncbi:MAG: sulfatase-like hydrolase/transferase, partial [Phycisphaerales bacterium JB041]